MAFNGGRKYLVQTHHSYPIALSDSCTLTETQAHHDCIVIKGNVRNHAELVLKTHFFIIINV